MLLGYPLDRQLEMSLLACASPEDLLSTAGIDPMDETTYQEALDYFGGLVDTYEELVDAKLAE